MGLFIRSVCLLGMVLAFSACSSNGEISDVTKSSVHTVYPPAQGIVSGSQQNVKTANGYTVSASVGAWTSGNLTQTVNGYQVYSTIQGNLASETSVTVNQ
jgi:ABC-type Fe3+-hydroxamate transport system substrate-binding protein